jgi:fumarate reductase iron-sulfur subunit
MRQAEDEVGRLDQLRSADRGTGRIADIREEMQSTMEDSAGIFRSGDSLTKGIDRLAELQQRSAVQLGDEGRVFNTELVAALELANMLDIAETMLQSALQREESRGAHQRTDFTARDDERFLNHALAYRDTDGSSELSAAGDDHPMATRRAGLRKVVRYGRQHPDAGDAIRPRPGLRAHVADYEVPLRKDWAILDGLNYVKDHVDGSLSYRWSCRMGICGSCGMNVDGEPKLTCATFLSRLRAWPDPSRAADQLSGGSDLVVDIEDFMEKLPGSSRGSCADDDSRDRWRVSPDPEELEQYKQFSNCINCMLCYAACPIYGLEPDFIGPAAIALAERYDLDSRDRGQRERLDVLIEREGVWGCTFVGECTRVCPKHVDPAGAIQRYKLKAAKENVMAFLLPRGAR